MFVDTHCHIHESDYRLPLEDVISRAHDAGVIKMICVGTNIDSSEAALRTARQNESLYASIGVHPHDVKNGFEIAHLVDSQDKLVAIGEIGLDYFYTLSPKSDQVAALEFQLDLAINNNLPVIFHVRDAFDDFWPILDNFSRDRGKIRGVIHSFTDSKVNLDKAIERSLCIGVNGIATFTKDEAQKEMFSSIPLEYLLLETDSPFLTPVPKRGNINEPAYVINVASFLAEQKHIKIEELGQATTSNATRVFGL